MRTVAQNSPSTSPLSSVTVLHSFTIQNFQTSNNVDGLTFSAPLTLGSDGSYYGVAQSGGAHGTGTVFRVTRTGALTVLLTFESGNVNNTGATPEGSLIEDPSAPGTFYGTTQSGGDNASGTIFKLVTTGTVTETVLRSFGGSGDGIIPAGALALRGGVLYGTTAGGGAHGNAGTVYKIGTDGSGYAILHSFTATTDGSNPRGLVLGATLSGVVQFGGANGAGTVWNVATDGSGFKTLYTFGGTDGYSKPILSLALAGDGTLYGSFGVGTPGGYGGVYKITPQGAFSILHAFVYDFSVRTLEGGWPGTVTIGADGNLYGQLGQIPFNTPSNQFNPSFDHKFFQVRTSDGGLTLLGSSTTRTFQGYGMTALTAAPDGTLCGLENSAGATGYGDVIQLRPVPNHVLTVSKTTDDVNSINDPTTLRGAISAAQPGDAIVFSNALRSAQTGVTLTQGELPISQDLNIVYTPIQDSETHVGGSFTIDADGLSRIFHISGGVVDISGLAMTNGRVQGLPTAIAGPSAHPNIQPLNHTQGGGVLIDGNAAVLLSGVTISDCAVTGTSMSEGGGLCLAAGNLTFSNSSVTNCSAYTGGGIAVDAGPFVDTSPLPGGALLKFATLDTNKSMDGGGLAIQASGPVGMFFGTVTNNQAGNNGGGVHDIGGRTVIDNTMLRGNLANGITFSAGGVGAFSSSGSGAGGGLYNAGGFENLDNDVFSSNTAYSGGALDITTNSGSGAAGYTKIYFTTFSGNSAVLSSGGINTPGPLNGDGGAITVDGGTLDFLQSTVGGLASLSTAGNHADGDGGGIYIGSGTATINDITFYGNVAAGRGGAVFNSDTDTSDVTLYYCTITNNDAAAGGGLYQDFIAVGGGTGGELRANVNGSNSFTVYSAIIAQNTVGGFPGATTGQDAAVTAGGTFTSNGSNLIGNGDGATGFDATGSNHDQVGGVNDLPLLDPLLFPLGDYGGTTSTRALMPGSPALQMSFNIDNGLNRYDQRGVQRPYPNPYDIGAAEHPAPHVEKDAYTTPENTQLFTPSRGVLSNDYADLGEQPNPYPLTAVIATQPAHGQVTLNTDGSFTYIPNTGFIGTDSFTYIASDPISSSPPATVTLTVTGAVPSTTAALGGTLGSNSYYRSAVTVTLTATDPDYDSSLLTTTYSVDGGPQQTYFTPGTDGGTATGTGPFTVSGDGTHTVTFSSTDAHGSSEALQTVTFKIDATPPVTTATALGSASGTQVTLAATDAFSGIAATTYALDGGTTLPYTAPFTVQTNGSHTVTYGSSDNAGNVEATKTLTFTVNITGPHTAISLAGPQGTNGWYTGTVTVTLTATPGGLPVAATYYTVDGGPRQTYTGPFAVSGDAIHTVTFYSVDTAGTAEASNQQAIKIDATPPVTTLTLAQVTPKARSHANGAVYTGPVTATLSAKDALSGVAGTTYTLDGGAQQTYTTPITITAPSAHTLTYSSTDIAGNKEVIQTATFTIAPNTTAVLHNFPAGLQLFSVPKDLTGVPLGQALNQTTVKLAVWSPTLLQYVLTPTAPADALRPGQGYWARFGRDTNLYDLGTPTPTGQAFAIPIRLGWNMIGDPFPSAASPSNIRLQTPTGVFGLGDDVARTLLSPTTYTYDSGAGVYRSHSLRGEALTPYAGYWLYSRCDGSLLVSPP